MGKILRKPAAKLPLQRRVVWVLSAHCVSQIMPAERSEIPGEVDYVSECPKKRD
jgi:hypothetical protein